HRVVLDYPALASAAAVQSVWRRTTHALGARVEAYRVFSDHEIRAELASQGFRLARTHKQFVLPIALHKAIGSAAATERIEGALAAVGLRGLLGSPVTLVAERAGPA